MGGKQIWRGIPKLGSLAFGLPSILSRLPGKQLPLVGELLGALTFILLVSYYSVSPTGVCIAAAGWVLFVNMREVSAVALRVAQGISAIAVICACASMAMAHDEMQLQQLLNTKECAGCDLTNADLAKANLGSAN